MECKCGSNNLYEKQVDNMHKIGVYCCDCDRWVKWGKLIKKEETNMFEVNHNDAFSGGLIKEGKYEVIIKDAKVAETKANKVEHIAVDLVVRNDVDQAYKNKYVFHKVWKTKATGEYSSANLNAMAKAVKIPHGTKFASLDEFLEYLINKTAKITIKHEEYKGEKKEKVAAWEESATGICAHVFKDKSTTTVKQDDDDCPF